MIPQSNLSLLSNRLSREGGHRIPEGVLERDYCLSWFLVGLSHSPLKDVLYFKGGTALKKCYFPEYRFSEDLDFTLATELPFPNIQETLNIAFSYTERNSGIKLRFDRYDRRTHENSYTFFLAYEGPLPSVSAKDVKVDITRREKIVFEIENRILLQQYDEYEDLPDDAVILVYSLAEIGAEKVIALLDPARNEPRDLYDVWYLAEHRHISMAELAGAIELKSEFRDMRLTDARERLERKKTVLKRLWETRLRHQMSALPEFDKVYRAVFRQLRQAGFMD